ncbi:MAG TPA: hypothetical protein VGR28_00310 [Candidatus Thermoplasmatota archaeon]|jgi:hypothetical protein|nr:hypothetical protein [Candidatus Thermoplasmatota archaeon]
MLLRTEEDRLKRLAEAKEIKVKIPLDFHIKLHTLKVLKGQSISDTVEIALGRYFSALTVEMAHVAAPSMAPTAMPEPEFVYRPQAP